MYNVPGGGLVTLPPSVVVMWHCNQPLVVAPGSVSAFCETKALLPPRDGPWTHYVKPVGHFSLLVCALCVHVRANLKLDRAQPALKD